MINDMYANTLAWELQQESGREEEELDECEDPYDDAEREELDHYYEDMDGDHESGLASAGWGTDEDYEHNLIDDFY